MANKPHTRCIQFSPEGFLNQQKEHLFNALLKNHLIAAGYLVARPEPDLGDDLWFTQTTETHVRRGQTKSVHSCTVYLKGARERGCRRENVETKSDGFKPHDGGLPRRYSVKFQVANLRKWANERGGYVYFFGLADDRFHGLAEGLVAVTEDDTLLRVDMTRVIKNPKPHDDLGRKETKRNINHQFRAVTRGFHIGCIPCWFFRKQAGRWQGDNNGLWFQVDDCSVEGQTRFRYRIGKQNVTRYFGQTTAGLEEAMRNAADSATPTL